MPTRIIGAGVQTGLGRGLSAHAAALRAADEAHNALPATTHFELADEQIDVPYHLASPLDRSLDLQDRFHTLLESVVADALEDSGLTESQLKRTGVFLGTSSADIGLMEDAFRKDLATDPTAPPPAWRCSMDNLVPRLRRRFSLGCEGVSVNTACTASANALIYADAAIQLGELDHALVIGSEIFNATTALGFHSLDLLTSSAMHPLDARRNGLVLGEACTAAVLERSEACEGTQFIAGATLSDTNSISAANPDGSTIADVIKLALERAELSPSQIDAIKVHATASLLNDEAETAGLLQVFETLPPVVALKPYIGHTFGASGLTELLMIKACLEDGFWPANPGIAPTTEELGVALNQTPLDMTSATILLNQFGFGGNNTCLVLKHDA